MASKKTNVVQFRRKRLGRTDYKKRLRLLLSGKDRLVIRFSARSINASIVRYEQSGDKVLQGVNSHALEAKGWKFGLKNFPAAYLTGLLLAKKANAAGYEGDLIVDTGFLNVQKQSRLFAVIKGALDGGLNIKVGEEEIFPTEERFSGEAIADYANKLKGEAKEKYDKQFSRLIKNGTDPAKIAVEFAKVKATINA